MASSSKEDSSEPKTTVSEAEVRPSISVHLIRHAESGNNEVYRNARYLFRGGTPEFDEAGWNDYVETNRKADPGLSSKGERQADILADYLAPHLAHQASRPVRIVTSPMRRTLLTIRPTLTRLRKQQQQDVHVTVNAFYHESEGCHTKSKPEEGMNPAEITEFMKEAASDIDFVGFPKPDRGWYVDGKGEETRAQSEERAAKFYLWLSEHLDEQLRESQAPDVFDAGVLIDGEEKECEHDKHSPRIRRRRTALVIGHADFMGLVIKRIVAGYGHYVETEGHPHRSAFVHFNTGITELEYFGNGRFLLMCSNHTPHISPDKYSEFRSGGSLKDGWSYIMPVDKVILNAEVTSGFADEMEGHVHEQTKALKSLYLKSGESQGFCNVSSELRVEDDVADGGPKKDAYHFIVKRGLQVVGVATYSQTTGRVTDVAIRPSAASQDISAQLMAAIKAHARKQGRSGSLVVRPRSTESKPFLEAMGFMEMDDDELQMEAPLKKSKTDD